MYTIRRTKMKYNKLYHMVAALLVGLGSLFVSRTSRLNQDTALSILHTTAFAAGFIVLVRLGLPL